MGGRLLEGNKVFHKNAKACVRVEGELSGKFCFWRVRSKTETCNLIMLVQYFYEWSCEGIDG